MGMVLYNAPILTADTVSVVEDTPPVPPTNTAASPTATHLLLTPDTLLLATPLPVVEKGVVVMGAVLNGLPDVILLPLVHDKPFKDQANVLVLEPTATHFTVVPVA